MNSLQTSLDLRVAKEKVCFALDVKNKLLQFLFPIQPVTVSDTDGQYFKCDRGSCNKS